MSGTYSAGNEPDENNICIVLKNEEFTIYDQEKILKKGLAEEVNTDSKAIIYRLVSEDNTKIGYIVCDKDRITLLDFKGKDFTLKKISSNAIYLNYKSE